MASRAEELRIRQVFLFSLALKAVFAAFELLTGLALALLDAEALQHTAVRLLAKALAHHPQDRVLLWFADMAAGFSIDAKTFAAIYLAVHGLVKLALVLGLWRNQAWSYPVSLIVFAAFIVYQIYRFVLTGSVMMLVLAVFDIFVMVLIWHEWRQRRAAGDFNRPQSI